MSSRGRIPCSNQSPTSGHDLLADELPHGVADRPLLVVEQRVEREEVERVERGRCGGGGCHVDSSGPGWPDCRAASPRRRGPAMMPTVGDGPARAVGELLAAARARIERARAAPRRWAAVAAGEALLVDITVARTSAVAAGSLPGRASTCRAPCSSGGSTRRAAGTTPTSTGTTRACCSSARDGYSSSLAARDARRRSGLRARRATSTGGFVAPGAWPSLPVAGAAPERGRQASCAGHAPARPPAPGALTGVAGRVATV